MTIINNFSNDEIENFLNSIDLKILEKRPLSTHIDIVEQEPLWPKISNQEGLIHSNTKKIVELAFDNDGFIAGGFGKWMSFSNKNVIERGAYLATGGDIDLFFKSNEGWKSYIRALSKLDNPSINVVSSKGNYAVNIKTSCKNGEHKINKAPPVQAIGCAFGNPQDILRGFDFINCMFASERDKSYAAIEAIELENSKILGVAAWISRSLVHRFAKYYFKYGYMSCKDMSAGNRVEHLCSSSSVLDENSGANSASQWYELLTFLHENFFEDKDVILDILKCKIIPYDKTGKFSSSLSNFCSKKELQNGSYFEQIETLLEREKRAKLITNKEFHQTQKSNVKFNDIFEMDSSSSLDEPTWKAEQYCWSI